MDNEQVMELLYQALETEIGGALIYEASVRAAENEEVREEWQKYLEETRNHEQILLRVFEQLSLDPANETPGRQIVRAKGLAQVQAIETAISAGKPGMAQLVASESIVEAETKDHQNWELIGQIAKNADGQMAESLQAAFDEVEDQEDEHLYHTMGWSRELWLDSLGLPAVLPPPEEAQDVKSALEAARAKESRTA